MGEADCVQQYVCNFSSTVEKLAEIGIELQAEFKKITSKVDDHGKRLRYYYLRIATWNARTLYRVSTSAQLAVLWLVRDFVTLFRCSLL